LKGKLPDLNSTRAFSCSSVCPTAALLAKYKQHLESDYN
jgi:hypothetical protein